MAVPSPTRVDFVRYVYPPGNTTSSTSYLAAGDMLRLDIVGQWLVATRPAAADGERDKTCRYPLSVVARVEP